MKIVTIDQHCCRPHGASCKRCQTACPAGAISFDVQSNLPVIDEGACTKCGVCIGVCDAFSSSAASSMRLYEHLRKVAMRGELVYLTCSENVFPGFKPAKNVTVLPCLATLPSELWTLLLAQNVPVCVACDLKYCEDCEKAPRRGELLFSKAIELAEQRTGCEMHFDREIPELVEISDTVADEEFDRRGAFDSVKDDAFGIISGKRRLKQSETLQEAYRKKERERMRAQLNLSDGRILNKFAEGGTSSRVMPPRRSMLLEAYAAKPEIAEAVEVCVSATWHEQCVECMDCTKACMTGARAASPSDGSLSYDARYCVGCGACEVSCPRQAIELVEATFGDLLPDGPGTQAVEPNLADYE